MNKIQFFKTDDEKFPEDKPGSYLVWVKLDRMKELRLCTARIKPIQNGLMKTIDGHFFWDYLGKNDKIIAWAIAPPPPNWSDEK